MKPIAFYVLDLATSLINEKATQISIMIRESGVQDQFIMTVAGCAVASVNKDTLGSVTDVPLLRYQASISGGSCQSEVVGNKTVVITTFRLSHPERSPLGDMAGMLTIMISVFKNVDFDYVHSTDTGTFCFSTAEIRKKHNINKLEGYEMLNMIGSSISEGLKGIGIADINI